MKLFEIRRQRISDSDRAEADRAVEEAFNDSTIEFEEAETYAYIHYGKEGKVDESVVDWVESKHVDYDYDEAYTAVIPMIEQFIEENDDTNDMFIDRYDRPTNWDSVHQQVEKVIHGKETTTEQFIKIMRQYLNWLDQYIVSKDEWMDLHSSEIWSEAINALQDGY